MPLPLHRLSLKAKLQFVLDQFKGAASRKIAVILHRMWIDGTTYRWTEVQPIAALA